MDDFKKYRDEATAWIAREAGALSDRHLELSKQSEALYQLTSVPFRYLLADPIGPAYTEVADLDGRHIGSKCGLVAVGVHGAGDYLPYGRHSDIFVSSSSLKSVLSQKHPSKLMLGAFLALFNEVYRRFLGRQHTLIHSFLHRPANTEGCVRVVEMCLTNGVHHANPERTRRNKNQTGPKFEQLPLSDILEYISDDIALSKYTDAVAHNLNRLVPTLQAIKAMNPTEDGLKIDEEAVGLFADRVVAAFQADNCNPSSKGFCFGRTFARNVLLACAFLEKNRKRAKDLCEIVTLPPQKSDCGTDGTSAAIREIVEMLHLFSLYRKLCGDWFYVIVPPKQDHLTMCFTVGTSKPLTKSHRQAIADLACSIREEISSQLMEAHTGRSRRWALNEQWKKLRKHISPVTVVALERKGLKEPSLNNSVSASLVYYLRFCERISEVAVHEGRALHFDILVCDGIFASETVTRISNLTRKGDGPWVVDRDCEAIGNTALDPEETISRLLGNQAFLQQDGMLILGSREGRLLSLAKVLGDKKVDPEAITGPRVGDKCDRCYLLQVRERGDICVFFRGELVLWRRAGDYIVPSEYGTRYCTSLKKRLVKDFRKRQAVDFDVLTRAVWELSNSDEGATLVLGDLGVQSRQGDTRKKGVLADNSQELTDVFPHAECLPLVGQGGLDLLKALASQDGGVLIDISTGLVYGRRQLRPTRPFDWRGCIGAWKGDGEAGWEDWSKVLRWGTRHHSALAFSATAEKPNGSPIAVITISSDGDIHYLSGSKPVAELTYPRPAKG